MTNYAELIAEAECRERMARRDAVSADNNPRADRFNLEADYHTRIAAALRELAPPEGWRATEYIQLDTYKHVFIHKNDEWRIGGDKAEPRRSFPTASAAMAALDGEKK